MNKHLSRPFDPQPTKVIPPTFLNSYKNYCLALNLTFICKLLLSLELLY